MAFVFCDGFDSYAATADVTKKWDVLGPWTWASASGVLGGGCMQVASAISANAIKKAIRPSAAGVTHDRIAFNFKFSTTPASNVTFFQWSQSGTQCGRLDVLTTTGQIRVATSASVSIGTTASNYCDNAWHYAELDYSISGTTASATLRIDGSSVVSGSQTGSNGGNANDQVIFFPVGAGVTFSIDDVICWDDQGSAFNSAPLGIRYIETLRPSAAGDQTEFDHTGGASNYQSVNETSSDTNATYVSSSTSGRFDLYQFGDLGGTPASITAVVANHFSRAVTSDLPNVRAKAKNTNTVNGATVSVNSRDYKTYQQVFETDPATSSAWATSGVNSAQFGMELVS